MYMYILYMCVCVFLFLFVRQGSVILRSMDLDYQHEQRKVLSHQSRWIFEFYYRIVLAQVLAMAASMEVGVAIPLGFGREHVG